MDDREFISNKDSNIYEQNPDFTGNKLLVFTPHRVRLSRNFDYGHKGDSFYKKGKIYKIERMPSGRLYLLDGDMCFCSNAIEGRDFELIVEEKE